MILKELLEARAKVYGEIRDLAEKMQGDNVPAEISERWDKANAEYNDLSRKVTVAQRAADLEKEQREVDPFRPDAKPRGNDRMDGAITDETRALAFQAWCRSQYGLDVTQEQRDAAARVGMNPNAKELCINLHTRGLKLVNGELRAQGTLDLTAGGATVPGSFVNSLEKAMLWYGGVRQVAEVKRTSGGEEMSWPGVNDTSNKGARLGEAAEVSEQDVAFSARKWYAYKYTSKLVKVDTELMDDSAFELAVILGDLLGERLGRILNEEDTIGTGNSMPEGIVTGSVMGKTAASATAIGATELIDLIHSVDRAYRNGAAFMMHDLVLAYLRKVQAATSGEFIFGPGLNGEPDRIHGYPVVINNDMDSTVAATKKTVLFGQLSKYKIRDVKQIRLRRLTELYAETDQDGFVAFIRHDGKLLNTGGNPVKHFLQS
jgi:HK97 family phage major capsid protein